MGLPRESLWLSLTVTVVAVAALLALLNQVGRHADDRVALEDQARAQVELIADAQSAYHATHGRYGWLEDLRAEGLVRSLLLREIDGHLTAVSPGYRIDIMLPRASSVAGEVALVLHGAPGPPSPLEREHFVVVARPWGRADGGWRTFYRDETETTFVNEGVSDLVTRVDPPLPEARVPKGGRTSPNGMRWWPLHDLPPR
jgi:hypothetical protein